MKEIEQQSENEDQEISLLRELLPKVSGENRAFIKGATQALLYAQENQTLPVDQTDPAVLGIGKNDK